MTEKFLNLKIISGCKKTGALKKQMTQLNINRLAFEAALNACDRLFKEFASSTPDQIVIEALACLAIVEYTKNFNSENLVTFDAKIFPDALHENDAKDGLSQREFHKVILKYRSKHIVHSGQTNINADTGWLVDERGQIQVIPFIHWNYFYEDRRFYEQLKSLCEQGLSEAHRRLITTINEIKKLIANGEANLLMKEMPNNQSVSEKSPRELWELPSRGKK